VRMKQFGREILEMVLTYRGAHGFHIPAEAEKEAEKAGLDSKQLSYDYFKNGVSIPEIARGRQLAVSTIENHLLGFVASGAISIERLVDKKKVRAIEECVEIYNFRQVSDLRAKLGNDYSFGEIRFVLKYLEGRIE